MMMHRSRKRRVHRENESTHSTKLRSFVQTTKDSSHAPVRCSFLALCLSLSPYILEYKLWLNNNETIENKRRSVTWKTNGKFCWKWKERNENIPNGADTSEKKTDCKHCRRIWIAFIVPAFFFFSFVFILFMWNANARRHKKYCKCKPSFACSHNHFRTDTVRGMGRRAMLVCDGTEWRFTNFDFHYTAAAKAIVAGPTLCTRHLYYRLNISR